MTRIARVWLSKRYRWTYYFFIIHDVRHRFVSTAVAHGQGLPMIGKILGHTQVQTTARYAHLASEPVREGADQGAASIAVALA